MDKCNMRLYQPDLEEIKCVLIDSFTEIFDEIDVNVVQCPDLTLEPFDLAASGLCGNETIMQIGGVSNFFTDKKNRTWYLANILDNLRYADSCFVIGGNFRYGQPNNEHIANFTYKRKNGLLYEKSYSAFLEGESLPRSKPIVHDDRLKCDLIGNFYLNNGMRNKVVEVSVKGHKTQCVSFVEAMRNGLRNKYGRSLPVGLGGAFVVKCGTVKHSVVPREFPSARTMPNRFSLYKVPAPVVGVGSILSFNSIIMDSKDGTKDMKVIKDQNFYSFSKAGHGGGHYFNDCTSDVIYHGYFNIATQLLCMDVPSMCL